MAIVIMRDIHRHLDADELERYSMGAASEDSIPLIEEHLLGGPECQDRLRQSDDHVRAMRMASQQVRRTESAHQPRRWTLPAWFPLLAAAACGLLLVVAAFRFSQPPGPVVGVLHCPAR